MKKSLDEIAALEKAISKKYGSEAIKDPRSDWTDEKEAEYIEQSKKASLKHKRTNEQKERVEINGVFVSRKLLSKEQDSRTCPVCGNYSFNHSDDIYMIKYSCCFECWAKHVQGREERWKQGWRPNET